RRYLGWFPKRLELGGSPNMNSVSGFTPGGFGGKPPIGSMMARFDVNGDGRLDDQERQAMRAARPPQGKPPLGGRPPGGPPKLEEPSLDELIARFDVNGDGELDEEEDAALQAELLLLQNSGQQVPSGKRPLRPPGARLNLMG